MSSRHLIVAVLAVPLVLAGARSAVSRPDHDAAIASAMPAVVMIVAADVDGDRIRPVSSGSGTVVTGDGSILTNEHVLSDPTTGRLHDLFIVGRFEGTDRAPHFVCAGDPSDGVIQTELDLALVRCDRDMDGRAFHAEDWPTVSIGRSEEIAPGQPVWVLGYPDVGGNTLHVTAGLVSGWTGEHGGAGSRAFMKTDAAISHGNSGGTAIDAHGNFIGIPTAFQVTTGSDGRPITTMGTVGLIRPIEHARALLAVAARHAPPGPGSTPGVEVRGTVIAAESGQPVAGASIVVFRSGVAIADVDARSLSQDAVSWGLTNAAGEFVLDRPLASGARYSVAVWKQGYRPLSLSAGLNVPQDAPPLFQPWPPIPLER